MNRLYLSLPLFVLLSFCLGTVVFGEPRKLTKQEYQIAYQYLNQIRKEAGMISLKRAPLLEKSSYGHARFLMINRLVGHYQEKGLPNFTGVRPGDRALHAGYETMDILENFSFGQTDSKQSIDGLMSAIYHRFGFLDFSINEVGFGLSQKSNAYASVNYVYNMGNNLSTSLCKGRSFSGSGSYYPEVCRDQSKKIEATAWDRSKSKIEAKNPKIVLWPPSNARAIPPVFYEEDPDPLPDFEVSGYPVSIQFNPYYFKSVQLKEFSLFDREKRTKVRSTRLLNQKKDPNKKFTSHQFALFPLKRLEWNTWYRASVKYQIQKKTYNMVWDFKTKKLSQQLITLKGRNGVYPVVAGREYAIYSPPSRTAPTIEGGEWEYPQGVDVQVDWEDKNTLLITMHGKECSKVGFNSRQGVNFALQIQPRGSVGDITRACQKFVKENLPGNVIQGKGESLLVSSGKEYVISIVPSKRYPSIGSLKYEYVRGMKIDVEIVDVSTIQVTARGDSGDTATFKFNGGRSFSIKIE